VSYDPRPGINGHLERLKAAVAAAERMCDSYAEENQRFHDEIERLRAALKEIADDPTGVSSYQADIAKAALANQQLPDLMARTAVLVAGMDDDPDAPIEGPVDLAHQQKAPDDDV
jgi:hypothetical protein